MYLFTIIYRLFSHFYRPGKYRPVLPAHTPSIRTSIATPLITVEGGPNVCAPLNPSACGISTKFKLFQCI